MSEELQRALKNIAAKLGTSPKLNRKSASIAAYGKGIEISITERSITHDFTEEEMRRHGIFSDVRLIDNLL